MKKLVIGVMLGAFGIYSWQHLKSGPAAEVADTDETASYQVEADDARREQEAFETRFKCDERTRCSQMTSCAEAKYFLQNCPGVEMDAEGDGIPCEDQWCKGQ
jgi:predicted negative regulator of RcsB-dependent stress response